MDRAWSPMVTVRWVVSVVLMLVYVLFFVGNVASVVSAARTKKSVSMVAPFVSGVFAVVACWVCPDVRMRPFAPVFLCFDVALILLVLSAFHRLFAPRGEDDDSSK